ncbi:MAG: exodeoxyribonuclease VII large subunit [Dehalococcoidia bacterium]
MQFYSVRQVASYIRELIESDLNLSDIWIEGEVTNLKRAGSGHAYFSLKDNDAQLRCALFARRDRSPGYNFDQGEQVLCQGHIEFYAPRGEITFNVSFVQPAGVGRLGAEFERLKAQLDEEGLFDESRKRPLPLFPRRIAVVTSPDAAAWQDIQRVLERRWPMAEVLLVPTAVQGVAAVPGLVAALEELQSRSGLDVVIVARGGGSIEDLWAFNEEAVARAIFRCPVPVVTGIGHESDTTIADYVADLRASTPSVAAERAVPDQAQVRGYLGALLNRASRCVQGLSETESRSVERLITRLERALPSPELQQDRVSRLLRSASLAIDRCLAEGSSKTTSYSARVAALSPLATLERGYAVVQAGGRALRSPAEVSTGQPLAIRLAQGDLDAIAGKGVRVKRRRLAVVASNQSALPLDGA